MQYDKTLPTHGLGFCDGLRLRGNTLWFSDFFQRRVFSYDLSEQRLIEQAYIPGQPSGIGFLPDGSAVVSSMLDHLIIRLTNGKASIYADMDAVVTGPINELITDSAGRIYVGSFGCEPNYEGPEAVKPSPIYLVDLDGSIKVASKDLMFPNGMAINEDRQTMIVAETFGNSLTSFDISPDGTLTNPQLLAHLGESTPDGICLDSAGNVWVACPFSQEILCVSPEGLIIQSTSLPDRWAVAVALGNKSDTLFCLTADTTLDDYHQGRSAASIERFKIGSGS